MRKMSIMAALCAVFLLAIPSHVHAVKDSTNNNSTATQSGIPFTPAGTGTVVDTATDEDGKEFYTIKTADNNVFYLIIDRQRETENVYFLNAVTEQDLMALAEASGTDNKNGTVSAIPGWPSGSVNTPVPAEPEAAPESEGAPETEPAPTPKSATMFIPYLGLDVDGNMLMMAFLTVLVLSVGLIVFFSVRKSKRKKRDREDEYDEYTDEEDYDTDEDFDSDEPQNGDDLDWYENEKGWRRI